MTANTQVETAAPVGAPHPGITSTTSELRYRRLFESAQDGILILDAESGVVVDVNPYLVKLLGYPHTAFVGKALWELGFLSDKVANRGNFNKLLLDGYIRYENLPLKSADGESVEVEFVSNVYLVGPVRVIQCNIRNITARRNAERALQETTQFLTTLLEAIPVPVFAKDTNGCYTGFNRAFEHFYGRSRAELLGKTVFDLSPPELAAVYRAKDEELFRAPGIQIYDSRMVDAQGVTHDVVYHKATFTNSDGLVIGLIGVILDITERVRAQEASNRLATAVEQSAETIVITDAKSIILYANPAFEKTSGYTRLEAVGQNPRILKSGRHAPAFYFDMWAVLSRGDVWSGHFMNKRKDGALYEEDATISPVRDAAGTIVNYVAVKRDVTYEAGLEQQLRQAQKMEAVGRLAGGVAHDFNNLLMGIMGYVDLCRERLEPEHPIQEWLAEITRAALRSADITRQLLTFARKQIIEPKVIDLNDAVANMLKLLRRLIGENVNLVWVPGVNLHTIRIDPSQVDQILANLCLNARDAIAGVGNIILESANLRIDAGNAAQHPAAEPGQFVLLTVTDNGSGMNAETLTSIFEPFFTTKEFGKGTGLGLATVYGIVKQNGGFIGVTSTPGHGTTFRIYLPQMNGIHAETTTSPECPTPATATGETILLVEDERSLRTICRLFLDRLGYHVLLAEYPAEAIRLAAGHPGPIHLLLTDVIMAGMDGVQLAKQLTASRPGLRVLFMSGYTTDVMIQRGVLAYGQFFLAKPFSRNTLAQKLRETLAHAPSPATPEASR